MPFIVINTNKNAVIQCNMSRDLTEVMFDFTMPFEINDDNSILKRLHLYVPYATCRKRSCACHLCLHSGRFPLFIVRRHQTNHQVLRKMLPDHIYQYCVTNQLLDNMILTNDENIDNDVSTTFERMSATTPAITSTAHKAAVTMKG